MISKVTTLRLGSVAFFLLFALSSLDASSLLGRAKLYPTGGTLPGPVAVGDVNGDGRPDLLMVDACAWSGYEYCTGSGVGVVLSTGKGKFKHSSMYLTGGTWATSLALGDVNGDGRLDVVVANFENVGVLLGNGDGTFQGAQTFGSGSNADAIALADVNGDGKLDLILGSDILYLGNGDGTFQAAQSYGSGGYGIAVADVNGDGKPDMLFAGNGLSVVLGNGNGTFQLVQNYPSGGYWPYSVYVADLDGDGKLDAVVANYASSNVGVLLGNGDGTFQPVQVLDPGGFSPDAVIVADFDADGKADIAVFNQYSNAAIGVLLGNGDGTFRAPQMFDVGGPGSGGMAVGNLTGSAMPDLVVSTCHAVRHCVKGFFAVLANTTAGYITTTALNSNLNPSKYGQAVTFTAVVSSLGPTPTGRVKFMDGTKGLGAVALSSGEAKLTKAKLAVGTHSITAEYLGDDANAKSTSSVLEQVVQ